MKKAYCGNCQKVTEAVLVNKKEDPELTDTQCLVCGQVTSSMVVRDIEFKPNEWRQS